jgi:hypothetical protein
MPGLVMPAELAPAIGTTKEGEVEDLIHGEGRGVVHALVTPGEE